MAKRQALLFELMKEETPGQEPPKPKSFWDHLLRRTEPAREVTPVTAAQPEASTGEPLPTQVQEAEPGTPIQTPERRYEPPAGEESYASEEDTGRVKIFIRVNTFSAVLGVTIAVILIFCGFIVGKRVGANQSTAVRSDKQMAEVAGQEPQPEVMDVNSTRQPAPTMAAKPDTGAAPTENNLKIGSEKTRKKGLHYLIIQVFKNDVTAAERARTFLASKGIEASVERYKSKERKEPWFVLTSLTGFDRNDPEQKKQMEPYRVQIKALGQQYNKEKDAQGVDFSTCYFGLWK